MNMFKKNNPNSIYNFPVDAFPKKIQNIILATHNDLSFPIDFIGCSLLAAASTAVGNSCRVKVKEGWDEGVLLYLCLVGKPGTCKSHPMDFALKPIKKKDAESYTVFKEAKKKYDQFMGLSSKKREEKSEEELDKPIYNRRLICDSTLEALIEALATNQRGISVYADELAGWFKNFNRYNSGSDQEFWLSNWSQKPIIQDRKSADPVFIDKPFIGVLGSIQPGLLKMLANGGRSESGFMDRILFSMPANLQKSIWSDTELSPMVFNQWEEIINKLIDIPRYTEELMSKLQRLQAFGNRKAIPNTHDSSPKFPETAGDCSEGGGKFSGVTGNCASSKPAMPGIAGDCSNTFPKLPAVAGDCSVPLPELPGVADKATRNALELPGVADGVEEKPFLFIFSQPAWERLVKWQQLNKNLCDDACEADMEGIYSKLEIYIIRLSLLMQTLSWACGDDRFLCVGLVAVERAIKLVEYFRRMNEEVYALANYVDPIEGLTQKMQRLYKELPESFSVSDGEGRAAHLGVPIRTFKRFISKKSLFERVKRGYYRKAA